MFDKIYSNICDMKAAEYFKMCLILDPIELTCQEQECVEFQDLIEVYANLALATASYLAKASNLLYSCF